MSVTCAVMPVRRDHAEWRERRLHDWLLAVVRFAVTLEAADRRAVLARVREMDGLESVRGRISYFVRASTRVCEAITDPADPDRDAVLRRFVRAISKRRLREVVIAAVALDPAHG